ncbi:ABC transporter permease subunit [Clostridium sp. JNZ X4-2]
MIKNEFIKFFTPFKMCLYGGVIITFILMDDVIFAGSSFIGTTYYDFLKSNMEMLVFVMPIILAPVVSDIFTGDYESGCMKFFIIFKNRKSVFFSKIIALIFITAAMMVFTFSLLCLIYIIEDGGQIDVVQVLKMVSMFLAALMPVLLIYVMISILCKNSSIISLLVFLIVIMSDFIPKVAGDVTPRRFLWQCVIKGQIDGNSIILFLIYISVFLFVDLKLFEGKEILC